MSEITLNNSIVPNLTPPPSDPEIEEMVRAGVHMGHAKSKNHPTMQPYIFGIRNTVSVLDLTRTKQKFTEALGFIKGISLKGGLVLMVGTRPAARTVIADVAKKTGMPHFSERWIGGTLTNFKVISKRIEYMERLEDEKRKGEHEKYTKKERMLKDEEHARLARHFDGIRNLKKMPDAVFVVDITQDVTAVREARKMKIPIVALCDTNSNAASIDYPIPSNDDALPAVRYMVGRIGVAIEEGRAEARIQTSDQKNSEGKA